jgi:hypothetical protein
VVGTTIAHKLTAVIAVHVGTIPMTVTAISGTSPVASVQSERTATPDVDQGPSAEPASKITTGTWPPLSPAVLAALIGQQLTLYGSYN